MRTHFQGLVTTLAFVSPLFSFASGETPHSFSLGGVLFDGPNSSKPLEDSHAHIRVQLLNPDKTCILYDETQTIDTSTTEGVFNIRVGTSAGDPKRVVGSDPGNSMVDVFQNTASMAATCSGNSYTPATGSIRYLRVIVTPSGTGVADTLSPDLTLGSVPTAWIAERAESIQGITASQLLQLGTTPQLTQANVENIFSSGNYPLLTSLLSGNSSHYLKNSVSTGATLPSTPTTIASPTAGSMWFNSSSSSLEYYNGTTTISVGTNVTAGVTSVSANAPLSSSGGSTPTLSFTGTLAVANGGTNATTAAAAFNSLSPMTTLGDLIYGGTSGAGSRLAGPTSTSKQFLSSTGTGSSAQTPAWSTLASSDIPAPSGDISGTYSGMIINKIRSIPLSTASPTSGQVLSYNGTDWSPTTLPVTEALISLNGLTSANQTFAVGTSGTDFTISSSGNVHTLSIPNSSSANRGLLTAADWSTFNNKQSSITTSTSLNTASVTSNSQAGQTLNPFNSGAGNTGELRFVELSANGTDYVGFKAPDSVGSSRVWTLPAADGSSGQLLSTNGSGTLSWSTLATSDLPTLPIATNGSIGGLKATTGYLSLDGAGAITSITATTATLATTASTANALQGTSVASTAPTSGQVLTYNGTNWSPQALPIAELATGTSGSDFNITNSGNTYTLNFPNSSTSNRGLLTSTDWTTFNNKQNGITTSTAINAGSFTANSQAALSLNPFNTSPGNTGELRFFELTSNGSSYIGFKGPDSIAANTLWTLPSSDGSSGQILSTNGSGSLSWRTIDASDVTSALSYTPVNKAGDTLTGALTVSSGNLSVSSGQIRIGGGILPITDNSISLGSSSNRFTTVYATNALINISDVREKTDIQNSDLGLDFIASLRPVSYRWKTGMDHDVHYGLISQETEKTVLRFYSREINKNEGTPIIDYDRETGRYGMKYTELISPIIQAIQELHKHLTTEFTRFQALEAENQALKQENQEIKQYLCSKDSHASFCAPQNQKIAH